MLWAARRIGPDCRWLRVASGLQQANNLGPQSRGLPARSWILLTTSQLRLFSQEVGKPPMRIQSWQTPWLKPYRKCTHAMHTFPTHRDYDIINMCCFMSLNFWQFVLSQQKTNILILSNPLLPLLKSSEEIFSVYMYNRVSKI